MPARLDWRCAARWCRRGALCAALAAGAAWGVVLARRAHDQRLGVAAVEEVGGSVLYDFEADGLGQPPGPVWLRSLIGDDFFCRVEIVMFWNPQTGDDDLRHLHRFSAVREVYLDRTRITDAGLRHLEHLTSLRLLAIEETAVTEEGLARLNKKITTSVMR
ncbi:MAG: hypothetical protein RIC55_27200 [Pirellulaceae bacterium]